MSERTDARKVARLVTTDTPPPQEKIESLRDLVTACEKGEVTSFAFVAVGPAFAIWHDGWLKGRVDRVSILGALSMATRLTQDRELEDDE